MFGLLPLFPIDNHVGRKGRKLLWLFSILSKNFKKNWCSEGQCDNRLKMISAWIVLIILTVVHVVEKSLQSGNSNQNQTSRAPLSKNLGSKKSVRPLGDDWILVLGEYFTSRFVEDTTHRCSAFLLSRRYGAVTRPGCVSLSSEIGPIAFVRPENSRGDLCASFQKHRSVTGTASLTMPNGRLANIHTEVNSGLKREIAWVTLL